jgi:cytidylate kinase
MENLLRKYLEEKFNEQPHGEGAGLLPLVTISREFGCPSKLIARLLADTLNEYTKPKIKGTEWRFINKEVITEAAQELHLDPSRIQHLFNAERKGLLSDIFDSFSDHYNSALKIKKTIQGVVKTIAQKGNIILVGRAGVAITHDQRNALHIRLLAPLEWRASGVSYRRGITESEAIHLAIENDKRRIALIEMFLGRHFSLDLFDLVFNCRKFSPEEIVSGIIRMMEVRKMIEPNPFRYKETV